MRALVQRVSRGAVKVDDEIVGQIGHGLVILLGVSHDDGTGEVNFVADKCINLRIFEDDNGKMNRSLLEVGGEALIISQFTLYGDCRKGRRPGFNDAALPEHAIPLYEEFIARVEDSGVKTATGIFGASMQVEIINEGPVTLLVESK